MESNPSRRSSPYSSGCMASPSWLPAHRDNPSRFRLLGRETHEESRRSWRDFLKRLVKDGRSVYTSNRPLSFGYDAVSYSKNFDDGGGWNEGSGQCYADGGGGGVPEICRCIGG